jgi:hypothetical protein
MSDDSHQPARFSSDSARSTPESTSRASLPLSEEISSWLPRDLDEESSAPGAEDREAHKDYKDHEDGDGRDLGELADELTIERYHEQLQVEMVHPSQWIVKEGLTGITKELFAELHLVWLLTQKAHRGETPKQSARNPSSSVAQLRNGDVIAGRIRVLELIGTGKMGDVYRAWHVGLDGHVAVKVFHAGIHFTVDGAKWLKRHGRLEHATAEHPHVVFIADVGSDRERDFAALDFVPGIDLARRLRSHGPLEWQEACACILQAARGLILAHQQGRIQKGLGPGKLIYQQDGTVKLLDWGYGRLQAVTDPQDRDSVSPIISRSVDFVAPELVDGSSPDDPRSDLYSLGCTLYQLITGETPFSRHKSVSAKLHAHATETPNRLASLGIPFLKRFRWFLTGFWRKSLMSVTLPPMR